CADRNKRLDDMEAFSLWVRIRVKKGEDAVAAIGHVEDQHVEQRQGGGECISEIARVEASEKQHASGDGGAGNGGAQIGLEHDERQEEQGRDEGGKQGVSPVIHRTGAILQEVGEKKNECGLGQFRRLK